MTRPNRDGKGLVPPKMHPVRDTEFLSLLETCRALAMHQDYTDTLALAIRQKGGIERAMRALAFEFGHPLTVYPKVKLDIPPKDPLGALFFRPDGTIGCLRKFKYSDEVEIRRLDPESGKMTGWGHLEGMDISDFALRPGSGDIYLIAENPGRLAVVASTNGTEQMFPLDFPEDTLPVGLSFGPTGRLFVGFNHGAVREINPDTGQMIRGRLGYDSSRNENRRMTCFLCGPDGRIYSGHEHGVVRVHDPNSLDVVAEWRLATGRPETVRHLVFGPDGLLYAVFGFNLVQVVDPKDGQVVRSLVDDRLWNARKSESKACIRVRRTGTNCYYTDDYVYQAGFGPDGRLFLLGKESGGYGGSYVISVDTGGPRPDFRTSRREVARHYGKCLKTHCFVVGQDKQEAHVTGFAFGPDGLFYTAGDDGKVMVWKP